MEEGQAYPKALQDIIELFEFLPEAERREALINYADGADGHVPREGESFDLEDVRKDEECTDTVGIFLRVDEGGGAHFRVSLGPKVQTLTRAMTAILCHGLDGSRPSEVVAIPQDFVLRIIGQELVRLRSQTVYYVLGRMKGACVVWERRKAAAGG
jgi:cysteine desulfuration protein SufE